ncbi:MAG: WYL domain-containing protein [Propionicimonas sp.]|nr:WYL domain-containing protein [Propionicimonas sp.]
MAPRKTERIMNLTICLLMARRFVDKAYIREVIEGYHGLGDAAFERAFERDKDDLRRMGIPIETGSNDPLFPDETGYRIRRADFELPPIDFTPVEAAVLGLASRVWESATQADQAVSAMAKLRAAGVDPDPGRVDGLTAAVGAREPAFEALWQATVDRQPVRFDYRGQPRQVEPWTMTYRRGAWYLLGFDRDRRDERVFKVARAAAEVEPIGRPGSYDVPEIDTGTLLAKLEPAQPDSVAVVAIRGDRAPTLRRRGVAVEEADGLPPGFTSYQVAYASGGDLVGEVCSYGPDVVVVEPPDLREAVVRQLTVIAGGGHGVQ